METLPTSSEKFENHQRAPAAQTRTSFLVNPTMGLLCRARINTPDIIGSNIVTQPLLRF
jgi:hypothetical protein